MNLDELQNVSVLLVDDDEEDFLIIKRIMSRIPDSPFHLDWTPSYDQAKQYIKSQKYELYLIDYRLGVNTGLDLLEYAQPETRSQPFILLTGAGDQMVEWRSMQLAASDYLIKGSFDSHLLSRTLYYALQRKRIEERRIDELLELNRSKDEFISIASHQLRTPATGVKQYIGMVLEGFVGDVTEQQRTMLEKAYESNERQLQIVADLLKVAQVDGGKVMLRKETESINDLLSEIVHNYTHIFSEKKQSIQLKPLERDISLEIDYNSIRMVVENIIDNASKYSENDTTVTVELEEQAEQICIKVIDEGVGVDPKHKNRLFEKFSRLENTMSNRVSGTGLGLYWAKKIIDLHDGDIQHENNSDGGSTFTICLPKKSKV